MCPVSHGGGGDNNLVYGDAFWSVARSDQCRIELFVRETLLCASLNHLTLARALMLPIVIG